MPTKRLSDLFADKVKPTKQRTEYFDAAFGGLALRVSESGHKSWTLLYRIHGRQRRLKLGIYPALKTADARKRAAEALHKVEHGKDPAAEKLAIRNSPLPAVDTFETLLTDYLAQHGTRNLKQSTFDETKRSLERDVLKRGKWQHLPISEISKRHVLKLVNDIAADGAEVHANRIFSRLRALFNWAVAQDRLNVSPMHGLMPPTKEVERDRVLTDDECRWFWAACNEIEWPFGPIAQLLLLTAQRRTEVGDMDWSEINLAKATWVIPGERTKNGNAHEVYLSAGALQILANLPKPHRGMVFSVTSEAPVSGYSRAKERLDAAMIKIRRRELGMPEDDADVRRALKIPPSKPLPIEIPHWTFHDLRRTAVTKMAGKLKIAPHIVDKILNHTSGTIRGVAAVYNREQYIDERRMALSDWWDWLDNLIGTAPAQTPSNVVDITRGRA
jgi:integrase